jgi:PAS domain S-box-containing protein
MRASSSSSLLTESRTGVERPAGPGEMPQSGQVLAGRRRPGSREPPPFYPEVGPAISGDPPPSWDWSARAWSLRSRGGGPREAERWLARMRAASAHPLGDAQDLVPRAALTARTKALEDALRRSQDRLRLLVDAVSEYAIITLSPGGVIESWNTGAERLKGYSAADALGRHFSVFYTAQDRATGLPQQILAQAEAEGSCAHTGWRVRQDGSQFWGDVVISAVRDDVGRLTGFVKITRDLTEQHHLEAVQDSFYDAFEHDFRVPISAIKGFAELMRDADREDQEYLVDRVDSNATRLLSMVDELVSYARLRSGLTPVSLQVVDLALLAQRAVANLASVVDTARVEVGEAVGVRVRADPTALERVIANLVTNAVKYSPPESGIVVRCEQVGEMGVLWISDQGRGIDERDLDSIFMEFERGRLARDDSGTGLGLASVKRLMDLQGGAVSIISQVDVGTTVTLKLPLARDLRPVEE